MKKLFAIILLSISTFLLFGCSSSGNSLSLESNSGANPFDYIKVSFSGDDGSGTVEITTISSMYPVSFF